MHAFETGPKIQRVDTGYIILPNVHIANALDKVGSSIVLLLPRRLVSVCSNADLSGDS